MHNMSENALLQEIEEDLQRQRYEALWKRFGPLILTAAALVVLGTALISGWKTYSMNRNLAATTDLLEIVVQKTEKPEDAIASLQAFAQSHAGTNQGALAQMHAALRAIEAGDNKQAVTLYEGVASDTSVEPVYRELANFLIALNQFDDAAPADLEARLTPLIEKSPWRFAARELLGHLALRTGDKEKAKTIFVDLMNMKDIPPGIGKRAADMVQWIAGASS